MLKYVTLAGARFSCISLFKLNMLQLVLGRQLASLRQKSVVFTDKRVGTMGEILNYVKLIKMYAWDRSFAETVGKWRKKSKTKKTSINK